MMRTIWAVSGSAKGKKTEEKQSVVFFFAGVNGDRRLKTKPTPAPLDNVNSGTRGRIGPREKNGRGFGVRKDLLRS